MIQILQSSDRRRQNITAFSLILFFLLIHLLSVQEKSLTSDEKKHYRYGQNILALNSNRLGDGTTVVDDSKMPITAFNALPAKLAGFLPEGWIKRWLGKFIIARLVTVFFSCVVAWLVFDWSRALYGFIPGMASLVLFVFDPNLIAHSQLVTTDIYAAGTIAFSFYWLWRFANSKRLQDGVIWVVMLGFAQIAKYTAVVLLPQMLVALVLHDLPSQAGAFRREGWASIGKYLGRLAVYTAGALLACVLIINLGYWFNRSMQSFARYEFQSPALSWLQARVPILGSIPVPVPYPYLQGLDLISYRQDTGFGYGRLYLLGELRDVEGFPGYFLIASALKVPIASQLVLLGAFAIYAADRRRRSRFQQDEVFLLIPVLFFTVYFNFFFNTQIGIRFYLVVFPLLYVFAGQLFQGWQTFSVRQKYCAYALATYLVVSVLSYHPHYLTYFNEIVYDRRFAYKFLADSNLDWEQSQHYLQEYLMSHPDARFEPKKIDYGHLVISANALVGVTADPAQYQYLREYFEPVDTIAYSYLIYKITPEEFFAMCAKTNYCNQ